MAKDLTDITNRLRNATDAMAAASRTAETARAHETNARNALNAVQREFDEAIGELKKNAPWGSDWGDARQRRDTVRT